MNYLRAGSYCLRTVLYQTIKMCQVIDRCVFPSSGVPFAAADQVRAGVQSASRPGRSGGPLIAQK